MNSARVDRYVQSAEYCVRPHTDTFTRPLQDDTVQFRQFSCAGFVIEAYKEAGIELIDTDETRLPLVGLAALCAAYPDQQEVLYLPVQREKKNLPGEGPWPVVMAGYVINALDYPRDKLPYTPQPGDEYFPPRRPAPS
jgi:hypothetical protein